MLLATDYWLLKMHDVIIIGAGPAGLSAALWCDELGLDTLVLERGAEIGGQLLQVYNRVTNHLGVIEAEHGREMRDVFAAQISEAEFDLWTGAEIERVDLVARRVVLRGGEELRAISVVIATGVRRRRLGVPGEAELAGRGVVESATRDRELLAGRDVCVVGGGDAGVENALMLAEVCPTVTLVHRGEKLRARASFVEKLQGAHCVTLFTESVVKRIIGGERVEAVEIERRGAIKPFQMAVGGILVRIGVEPNSELFRGEVVVDDSGYIDVTSRHETNIENVFAVGDVSNPLAPTISGAVGAGATVAKVIASRLNSGRS